MPKSDDKTKSDDKIIRDALSEFQEYSEFWSETFDRAKEDLRFRAGEQWPDALRRARENDPYGARPCLTLDRTNQYCRQVVNDARQNKPAIKVRPVDSGADIKTADMLQGLTRQIEDVSRADIAYDTALDGAVSAGLGWFRIITEVIDEANNYQEPRVKRIPNMFAVISDADWAEPDGSDMMSCFIIDDLPLAKFKRLYPQAKPADWEADEYPEWISREMVRVAEHFRVVESLRNTLYLADGQEFGEEEYWALRQEMQLPEIIGTREKKVRVVEWRKLTAGAVLESSEFPASWIPVIPVIGNEHWIDGKRQLTGMVHWMIDGMRMYNYGASAVVEYIALQPKAPFIGAEGQFEGYEQQWAQANVRNIPYLEYKPTDVNGQAVPAPGRQPPPFQNAAWMQAMQMFDDALQSSTGMYKASLGAPSNEKSGKAIMARQREGDMSTFHYIDNLSRSIRHGGRIILDMIPRLYDTRRIARILGEDGATDMVTLNPEAPAAYQEVPIGGEVRKIYNPTLGAYDVTVSVGPAYTTRRQEAAEAMMEMSKGNPGLMQIIGDLMVQSMDWPMADKIADRLKALLPPQIQQAEQEEGVDPRMAAMHAQMQQQMGQMQQALQALQAENAQLKQQAETKQAEIAIKSRETDIKAYEAETDRLQAVPPITPEQVQALVMQTLHQVFQSPDIAPGM